MEFPFRKLLKCRHALEPLAWWEGHFGRAFPSVQPFLIPCPAKRAEFYPCPDNFSVRLTIREFRKKYRAAPTGEHATVFDDVVLDWEDVQAHQLGIDRVNEALRCEFKLAPGAAPQMESLEFIGRCDRKGESRHVFACLADSEATALTAISPIADPQKVGCVLFSTYHSDAADLLRSRGIASVSLRECLSLKKAGFSGECSRNCSKCRPPDISNTELKKHLDVRLDTIEETVIPSALRGSRTIRSAAAGGRARAEPYLKKYEAAKEFMLDYHKKNPAICFTQALRKAAQHLHLSERALKTRINKGDFIDW
jgi:hypothetical protein